MIIAIICSLIVIIILLIIFIYLWERRHKCKVHENVSYYEKDNYFNKPFFGPRESTPISFNPKRFSTPCDAKRVVDAIWNASDDDFPLTEKVVELRGITLYRRDLLKLRSSDWINDEIINFYFAMLVDRAKHKSELPKVYAFNTFFYRSFVDRGFSGVMKWTKNDDIFSHDILLIPIHQNVHWSLVVIDIKRGLLEYYDSIMGDGGPLLELFRSYLVDEYAHKKSGTLDVSHYELRCRTDIPTQANGYDCGIFVCRFAECASRRAPINFTQDDMSHFRAQITYEICSTQLLS